MKISSSLTFLFVLFGLLLSQPVAADNSPPDNGAQMATIIVANLNNSGPGSLRQAILDAAHGDTIQFDPLLSGGTITLSSPLLVNKGLTIHGNVPITISGNHSVRVFEVTGGLVFLDSLSIVNGQVTGNGGGILVTGANSVVVLKYSSVKGNTATNFGGGISVLDNAVVEIFRSTVANNTAAYGGGVYLFGPSANCMDDPSLFIRHSTISGNTATIMGGGISNANGQARIFYSTIAGNNAPANSGGGIRSWNDATTCTVAQGSIVAGNGGADLSAEQSVQRFNSHGYNLIGTAGLNVDFALDFTLPGDQTNVSNPMLGFLTNNGGKTETHALLPNSPALDAGHPTACAGTDQRGVQRPSGAACDIGAYEQCVLTVTNLNNAGPGSLRQTIADACPNGLIQFAPALSDGTITLASELTIEQSMTIQGNVPITISGNNVTRVFLVSRGDVTFDRLTIANGKATNTSQFGSLGGGIYVYGGSSGYVVVNQSVIRDNEAVKGGGIAQFNLDAGTLLINQSTLTGNMAQEGGGVYTVGANASCLAPASAVVRNSTLSGNTAALPSGGGAIFNYNGVMEIVYSTITGNTASSAVMSWNDGVTCTRLGHTIVSGNSGADLAAEGVEQRYRSLGYNLLGVSGPNVSFAIDFNQPGDMGGITNPMLGALTYSGGPTPTHGPRPGSPAIDAGAANCGLAVDQRGVARPAGVACDIGAVEGVLYQVYLPLVLRP